MGHPSQIPRGHPAAGRLLGFARREPAAAVTCFFLAAMIVLAVTAPIWVPYSPVTQNLGAISQPPSLSHLLGTDDLGRDLLSRLVWGARVSLNGVALAVGIAVGFGMLVGVPSGYFGGVVDEVAMRIVDTLLSFPAILLAIAIVGTLGPNLTNAMIAVGVVFFPIIARTARAQVLRAKQDLHITVVRSFGASHWRIIFRHILPNSVQPVIVQAALLSAFALLAEASLSFLGLGVQPPDPSWGQMLGRAFRFLRQSQWQIFPPGIAITVTALSFNILGDALRRELDPRV